MDSEADLKMDIAVGRMLRAGVTVAAAVVFAGALLYLAQARGVMPDYRVFHGKPYQIISVYQLVHGMVELNSRSVIQLGILLLVATPVIRVLFCVVGFAAQKDWLYVTVSSTVLAVLFYSLFFRV